MQKTYLPEGAIYKTIENRDNLSSFEKIEKAYEKQLILEGIVLICDENLSLHIDMGCMIGIMPKEEAQLTNDGEKVKDIAVLTRVGKPICFKIKGFSNDSHGHRTAILSRRLAQFECMQNYINTLMPGDIIPSKVTHNENFGTFVDIGCGIISLLPIDSISISRIKNPRDRLIPDDRIYTVVKSIDGMGRIYVSQKELLGTWKENASQFYIGETVRGIVRSVENYGIFIELAPNLAGLAEVREDVYEGDIAAVFIKNIIKEKMKIKLAIIDISESNTDLPAFKYYIDPKRTKHIDYWSYSPKECKRSIETFFDAKDRAVFEK